jgi:hypothetical protein
MKKICKYSISLLLFFLYGECDGINRDSTIFFVNVGYGLDLCDTYTGINFKKGIPDFASLYSAKFGIIRKWYGGSIYYGVYKNTYRLKHFDSVYEFVIPDMVEGQLSGIDFAIHPIRGGLFGVSVEVGMGHAKFNNLQCNSWRYQVVGGSPVLIDTRYILNKYSGFFFSYGLTLSFAIRRIRVSPYFKVFEQKPVEEGTQLITTGIELNYYIN